MSTFFDVTTIKRELIKTIQQQNNTYLHSSVMLVMTGPSMHVSSLTIYQWWLFDSRCLCFGTCFSSWHLQGGRV